MRNTAKIAKLSQDDWSYAAIQDIFDEEIFKAVVDGLALITWEEAQKDFYIQREANLIHYEYFQKLFSPQLLQSVLSNMEMFFNVHLDKNINIVAHKMIRGDYIGVHTDMNTYGETHRLTIMLNDSWGPQKGGVFMSLKGKSLSDIRDAWLPLANTGIVFEISEHSFHAVSPITSDDPRYSLIFTFKKVGDLQSNPWVPFVLSDDLENAISTASFMGISIATFSNDYEVRQFDRIIEFYEYLGGALNNAPKDFSYSSGTSVNVDQMGRQQKGSDHDRIDRIKSLRRIPLPIIVSRKDGTFTLVDGSHRLSYAVDYLGHLACAVFTEV